MESGRQKFSKFKPIINIFVKLVGIIPMNIRLKLFNNSRMIGGKIGILIRFVFLKSLAKYCGDNVSIHQNVYIFNPHNLEVGNNVSVHPMSYLEAYGGINIGNDVSIAHGTSILSVNHTWESNIPIKYNPICSSEVTIEDDVWVGCGVRILAGVKIHSRSVIAAGSVVTKDIYNNSVFAGVPAKLIKKI